MVHVLDNEVQCPDFFAESVNQVRSAHAMGAFGEDDHECSGTSLLVLKNSVLILSIGLGKLSARKNWDVAHAQRPPAKKFFELLAPL